MGSTIYTQHALHRMEGNEAQLIAIGWLVGGAFVGQRALLESSLTSGGSNLGG